MMQPRFEMSCLQCRLGTRDLNKKVMEGVVDTKGMILPHHEVFEVVKLRVSYVQCNSI